MKRIMHAFALLCLGVSLAWSISARAANVTLTPVVPPTETGENSYESGEVFNVARLKPGFGTATCAVSGAACSATVNNAAGLLSVTTATAGASGTAPSVLTITNNKVQVGDAILCAVDANGATAGAVITCSPHITAAGTFTLSLFDASVTALTSSSLKVMFFILTQGNPN